VTPKSGRVIAWLSFLLGIGVSIAGNIGHAASDGMKPGEWAGAAFWPLALMLTIEILTRVRWQPERRWTIARFAALVLVALVAAVLSYRHLAGLMTYWGEDWANAHLGPLAVDGLMLIAATALLSISKERQVVPEPVQVPDSVPTQGREHPEPAPVAIETTPQDAEITRILATLEDQFPADPQSGEKPVDNPERQRVETSTNVPASAAEEAAFQAWMNAPRGAKPSVRKLAELSGLSSSKVHRLINGTGNRQGWKQLEASR
jgi:hypothetical protein